MQIVNNFSEQKIQQILGKMGYDECLFSTKSRVFVITFHSSEEVRVRIGNAAKTNFNEKAVTLLLDEYLRNHGAERGREDRNVIVFRKYHDKAYANSYGAVNKTDHTVEVNLDLTASENCAFTPSSGRSKIIIPPKSLKYLGASIIEPDVESFRTGFTFSSNIVD